METPRLDWDGAEVRDGKLTVQVTGEQPDAWSDAFDRTVTLLRSGRWEAVKLKKGKVSVSGVAEGDEDSLHHFLESVVQEANAITSTEDEDEDEDRSDEEADADGADDTDARMTDRFRNLSGDDSGSGDDS